MGHTIRKDEKCISRKAIEWNLIRYKALIFQFLCSLKALKLSSSPGPDSIPSCILKNCADYLFYPLFILFNKSLNISYFPDIWKESYIIRLHKSGNKNEVSNYRGIDKLSSIPKLFEQILTN